MAPDVARLVEGVTKISRINMTAPETRQAENVRKMLLAMVNDVRVVMVKLADRLHNMRTLEYLGPEKQQRISRETLDIYAPIAHRLGMGVIRGELEDLSFRFLEPEAFLALQKEVTEKRPCTRDFWKKCRARSAQACRKRHSRRSWKRASKASIRCTAKSSGSRAARADL